MHCRLECAAEITRARQHTKRERIGKHGAGAIHTPAAPDAQRPDAQRPRTDERGRCVPPECQAALLDVLEAIEPLAATVDWQNPASAELEAVEEVGRAAAMPFDDYTCPPLDRALHGPAFLELARGVGPGSVGYVEHVLSRD